MRVLQKFQGRIELKGKLHFDAKNLIYIHHFFMSNLKPLCELIFKYAPTSFTVRLRDHYWEEFAQIQGSHCSRR